jgi:hypothetical protein
MHEHTIRGRSVRSIDLVAWARIYQHRNDASLVRRSPIATFDTRADAFIETVRPTTLVATSG